MTGAIRRVVGLFGHPVGHSLSPDFQNAGFSALELPLQYVAFDVPPGALPEAFAAARALGFAGFNLTVPHKRDGHALVDELHASALRSGSINTVVRTERGWRGHDTDGAGFIRAAQAEFGLALRGKTVGILGAGGAARAVLAALAGSHARRGWLAARRIDAARECCEAASGWGAELEALELGAPKPPVDVVIQATSIGLAYSPASPEYRTAQATIRGWLPRDDRTVAWIDLVYAPTHTPFLAAVGERPGLRMDGLAMLLHQGALAFEIWTQRAAPVAAMRDSLLARTRRSAITVPAAATAAGDEATSTTPPP